MCHRPPKPLQTDPPGKDNHDSYGDGDIPEIDTPRNDSDTITHFPQEMPSRNRMQ